MIGRELFVERGQELFVVRKQLKKSMFETTQHLKLYIDEYYHCDHVMAQGDHYLLCDRVADAKIV
jgi:hypothetical protein